MGDYGKQPNVDQWICTCLHFHILSDVSRETYRTPRGRHIYPHIWFINKSGRKYQKLSLNPIAGLWGSGKCFGMFLGPSIGGALIDNYGYKLTAIVFISLYSIVFVADVKELWTMFDRKYVGIAMSAINVIKVLKEISIITESKVSDKRCLLQSQHD